MTTVNTGRSSPSTGGGSRADLACCASATLPSLRFARKSSRSHAYWIDCDESQRQWTRVIGCATRGTFPRERRAVQLDVDGGPDRFVTPLLPNAKSVGADRLRGRRRCRRCREARAQRRTLRDHASDGAAERRHRRWRNAGTQQGGKLVNRRSKSFRDGTSAPPLLRWCDTHPKVFRYTPPRVLSRASCGSVVRWFQI
jgi:hypothetical protein